MKPRSKKLHRQAGAWLRDLRKNAGLTQLQLAKTLGMKYYSYISQVENGFGRLPTNSMDAWARALKVDPSDFSRRLLSYYDPELYRLLFQAKT